MQQFGSPDALARLGTDGAHADSVELKALLVTSGRTSRRGSDRAAVAHLERAAGVPAGHRGAGTGRGRGRDPPPTPGPRSLRPAVSARRSGTACERIPPRGVRMEIDVVPGAMWQDVEVRCEVGSARPPRSSAAGRAGGLALVDPARVGVPRRATTSSTWPGSGAPVHGPLVVRRVKVAAAGLGLPVPISSTSASRAGGSWWSCPPTAARRRWARPRRPSSGCSRSGTSRSPGVPDEDLGVAGGVRQQPRSLTIPAAGRPPLHPARQRRPELFPGVRGRPSNHAVSSGGRVEGSEQ